jgi:hypothetical protein
MSRTVDPRLDGVTAKGSAARFATPDASPNGVGSDEKRLAGRVFERAVNRSGLAPKAIADRLRRSESSVVSRLVAGLDIPEAIARWIADPELRAALVEALAELPGDAVEVSTVVTIGRGRRAG